MNKFNSFFKNSYGWDLLSKYVIFLGLMFNFTKYTMPIGLLLIIWATFRSFSKNKSKRYKELLVFENFLLKIRQKLNMYKNKLEQTKRFKILTCPNCAQKLRVPRKKGKITVTCKKCNKKFEGKS